MVRNENLDALEGFGPFDVILDPVGASYGELNLKLLARDGRWVIIGLMGGRKFELDLAQVLGKRLEITGSTLRNRDDGFKGRAAARAATARVAAVRRRAFVAAAGRYLSCGVRPGGVCRA